MNPVPPTLLPPPSASTGSVRTLPLADYDGQTRLAQMCWANRTVQERLTVVREFRVLLATRALELATLMANQRERPVLEVLTAEVMPLIDACRFLEKSAQRLLRPQVWGKSGRPFWLGGVVSEVRREPFGIVLIIGPGNYPFFLPGVQILQALTAGNAVLVKPGVRGEFALKFLARLLDDAGLPSGLLVCLGESVEAARHALKGSINKVVFTGSATIGKEILAQLAPRLLPATLELGGCDAVIVCADADLDVVASALAFGLTLNGGATCIGPRRVFVHQSIATELERRLALKLSVVSGSSAAVQEVAIRGTPSHSNRVQSWIAEAIAAGGRPIIGAESAMSGLLAPVVIADCPVRARLLREDVFAPVLALVPVPSEWEAVRLANDCEYGLGAAVFSRDEAAGGALARMLRAGFVAINDLIVPSADPRVPFGGRGHSGYGTTRGGEGLLEMTVPKVVSRSRGPRLHLRPARVGDAERMGALLQVLHGRSLRARLGGMVALFKPTRGRGTGQDEKLETH